MPLTTPDVIGRYQVLRDLGGGGMGRLYLAQDPAIDRLIAIKLLREGYDSPDLRERFVREARSAGRLRHVHIVTIFDVGEHAGRPFIAMEYVEGGTLDDLIQRREPLPLERKLVLMDALLGGLHYAHRNGVIHRDVKPANLMIDSDGVLKILDFGIARLDAGGRTQTGLVMGTLNYIAPEQLLAAGPIDGRADLFAAGAVFYELLSYRRAFPGDLQSGILHQVLSGRPEPLAQIVPGLDASVIGFVNRCLEKRPEDRFADMGAARRELAQLRASLGYRAAAANAAPEPGSPGEAGGPRSPRRETLFRIRAEQIAGHITEAKRAVESGNYQDALECCQRALVLDPESPEALAVEEQARTALEAAQLKVWLVEARAELDRGSLTAASVLVERALSLNSVSSDAQSLRRAVDEARRKVAEEEARERRLAAAVSRGRDRLDAGDLASASEAVNEALGLDDGHEGALALKRDVDRAIELKRIADAEAAARKTVDEARRRFAAGHHEAAVTLLERATPHALVTAGLAELRLELQELERVRRELALKVEEATLRFRRQDFDGALALIGDVLAREPKRDDARALKTKIEAAVERQREVGAGLGRAQERLAAGQYEAAVKALDAVARLDPNTPGLAEMRRAAEAGLAAEAAAEVRRQFEAHLSAAQQALERRDWAKARERVQRALRIDATHLGAMALKVAIEDAAARPTTRPGAEDTVRLKPTPVAPAPTVVMPRHEPPASGRGAAPTMLIPSTPAAPSPMVLPDLTIGPRPLSGLEEPAETTGLLKNLQERIRRVPLAAAAGIAAVLLLLLTWVVWPSGPEPEAGGAGLGVPVPVVINVAPWATIEALTRADGGTVSVADPLTPVVISLPPGEYHLRAVNPNYDRPLELDFSIGAGDAPQRVYGTMPDFRADEEIDSILNTP